MSKLNEKGCKSDKSGGYYRKKGDSFLWGKNIGWKIKEKLPRCHISMIGGCRCAISPRARNGLAPALVAIFVHKISDSDYSGAIDQSR